MRRVLKSFLLIINYKTLIITTLSVISTYVCYHLGFTAKFPDMLVGVAIVFPVVFSIGSAYNRRENALQRISGLTKRRSRPICNKCREARVTSESSGSGGRELSRESQNGHDNE